MRRAQNFLRRGLYWYELATASPGFEFGTKILTYEIVLGRYWNI